MNCIARIFGPLLRSLPPAGRRHRVTDRPPVARPADKPTLPLPHVRPPALHGSDAGPCVIHGLVVGR